MNFEPTETQQLVREMVRTFADKEIKPRAAAIDREDAFPRDLYRRMADLGLLGMTLPAEYGGSGAADEPEGVRARSLATPGPRAESHSEARDPAAPVIAHPPVIVHPRGLSTCAITSPPTRKPVEPSFLWPLRHSGPRRGRSEGAPTLAPRLRVGMIRVRPVRGGTRGGGRGAGKCVCSSSRF